jgi:acetyl-CoA synthetase
MDNKLFPPPLDFQKNARLKSVEDYDKLYQRSITQPAEFWQEQAEKNLVWQKKWRSAFNYQPERIGKSELPYLSFFDGGELNVSENCLDRHLLTSRKNKAAIVWQGEKRDERRTLTYQDLHTEVVRFAQVLTKQGAKKGDCVTIFMPMIPETIIAMLACTRIGAIHSVVFSAFSSEALRSRIQDCKSSLVITSNVGFHGGKVIPLKANVDEALLECPTVKRVIVFERTESAFNLVPERDVLWKQEILDPDISNSYSPTACKSEDPLFILYTSGSTGKPKGVLHTTAGYLLYAHLTFQFIFDIKDEDLYWCTADVGWITGHSYVVYGPLSNGATVMLFEGVPTHPEPDRFWEIIEDHRVNIFYTAPTAIRSLMKLGEAWPDKHDLSSLRLLGTVGEPINPEAWLWYNRVIGKEKSPIVDTWWQTETGGIMITTLPGAHPTKPGSAGKPFFGVVPKILNVEGKEAEINESGSLVIESPWPGMIRGVYGDSTSALVERVYFSQFPGRYFTGDGCRKDEDGYYWLQGRIDDVINVSAHRFATAEIESALVSHKSVAEAAVVGVPHDTKGQGIYCFVTIKQGIEVSEDLKKILIGHVRHEIGPIATPEYIHFAEALPKTRSGKIMRRILRKIAEGDISNIGDTSTLADPSVITMLIEGRPKT